MRVYEWTSSRIIEAKGRVIAKIAIGYFGACAIIGRGTVAAAQWEI